MTADQCRICRYFQREGDTKGLCLRYPPTVHDRANAITDFPVVSDHWWCGEFTPAHGMVNVPIVGPEDSCFLECYCGKRFEGTVKGVRTRFAEHIAEVDSEEA